LIGIIVAAIVAFFLLVAAGIFFYCRRKRRNSSGETVTDDTTTPLPYQIGPLPPEAGGDPREELEGAALAAEVDVSKRERQRIGVCEMDAGFQGHEIGGRSRTFELPAEKNEALGTCPRV
jgi:hypothetical protein